MTLINKLRYGAWRAGLTGDEVVVRLASGERLLLQKSMPFGLGVAYEIFVAEIYRRAREISRDSMRLIVDIGANVGFTVAYWATRFPEAEIEAIEPLPAHVASLRRTVKLNGCEGRTTIHAAAAGLSAAVCEMVNLGDCSTVAGEGYAQAATAERIKVPVVDIFALIKARHIDLLKIDCEGAEYEILMDPRFGRVDAGNMILEWHATDRHPEADRDIAARLRELKWSVESNSEATVRNFDGLGRVRAGMYWCSRQ